MTECLARRRLSFPFRLAGPLLSTVLALVPTLKAAIVQTGDVQPSGAWTSSTTGYIGYLKADGALTVDAASALQSDRVFIGYYNGVTGIATVTGAGSTWTNGSSMSVGYYANGILHIEAGAQVSNTDGYVGYIAGSMGTASVSGANARWTNTGMLSVGFSGSGMLNVVDGGQVSDSSTILGYYAGSTGIATIAGSGSTLNNSNELRVANYGIGTLNIEAGGQATSSNGYVGYVAGSIGAVTISGTNSKWTNAGGLYVGYQGSGSLTLTDGGQLTTKTLYASLSSLHGKGTITATAGAVLDADLVFNALHGTNNSLSFGTGGTLSVTAAGGDLGAGYTGSGSLTVADGVGVSSPYGYLGYQAGSVGTATITGAGSKWTLSKTLYLGNSGTGTITIGAGGQLTTNVSGGSDSFLGYNAGSTGTATVTGIGSKWTNSRRLYIGESGVGILNVEAGAQVTSPEGYLGHNANSSGTVAVTGAGSRLNSDWLYVGYSGSGTLTILAGAQVSSENGYVGCNAGSAGTVTVSGANSKWTNTGPLAIGSGSLTVDDGAQVTAQTFYALLSSLHGNGRITATAGAILDADLVFNASGGTQCTVPFGSGGTLVVNAAGGDLGVRTGSLTVADGVTIEAANGYLGYQPGSIAIATVTGPGSTWTNSGVLFVGNSGTGTLAVNAGAQVSNSSGYLGYNAGSSGAATVTGSTWTNSSDLFVGNSGVGTLTIAAGGQVSNANGYVGYNAGSSGAVTVSGANSKWMNTGTLYVGYKGSGSLTLADGAQVTTKTLFASLSSLHGNGTITATTGAVLDADLVFNASYGMQSTLPFGSGGTLTVNFAGGDLGVGTGSLTVADGIAINSANGYLGYWSVSVATATLTGLGSTWTNSGSLNVGFSGSGSLAVEAGACVTGVSGTLGCNSGSVGVAVVTGLGSKWTSSDYLTVGKFGAGTLTVKAGGYISSSGGMLGFSAGVTGTATVVGAGSAWTSNRTIYIGASGSGRLAIREGGTVTASAVSVNSQSLLTLDVGHGSSLGVGAGTGTITNAGKIRFLTGLQPTAGGQFSPIAAATWSGTGIYQAVGGTWNTTTHVFTVSDTLPGVSGTPIAVDLSQQQRVLVQENAINRAIGASFLSKTGTGSTLNFTAATLTDADLPSLQALLQPGESVLNAWNLSADGTGYVATDPIYLSLSVPSDLSRHDVEIWKLTGTTWSPFTADDLTTADGYASFTITGLSGYAVTVVPEPSTILLLLLAAAPLIARRLLRSKRA